MSINGKFTISKSSHLSYILVLTKPSEIDKYKSKNEDTVYDTLALFN